MSHVRRFVDKKHSEISPKRSIGGPLKGQRSPFRRRPAESNLDSLGEERLREALEPFDLQFTIGSVVEVDAFRREQEGEVWRYLAFAAGLFLLLELFVAWWFGRKA